MKPTLNDSEARSASRPPTEAYAATSISKYSSHSEFQCPSKIHASVPGQHPPYVQRHSDEFIRAISRVSDTECDDREDDVETHNYGRGRYTNFRSARRLRSFLGPRVK